MFAEPLVHGLNTTWEFGLLFDSCDVVGYLLYRLFFNDDLIDDTGLVQVFNTFSHVDLTDHRCIVKHFILILYLFFFLEVLIFGNEDGGYLLFVGNFLGSDDFFRFRGQLKCLVLLDLFLEFIFESCDLDFGVDCDLLLLGLAERSVIEQGEQDQTGDQN